MKSLVKCLSLVISILLSIEINASTYNNGYGGAIKTTNGYVIARTVVRNEEGSPILVEFDLNGEEVGPFTVPGQYQDQVESLEIVSAYSIEAQILKYQTFMEANREGLARDAQLMSRAQFDAASFIAADNSTTIEKPALPQTVKSVLVRSQANRINHEPDSLVLQRFPFVLSDTTAIVSSSQSVLLDPDGNIIGVSDHALGYRTGFFGKQNGELYDDLTLSGAIRRRGRDEVSIFGPIANNLVYVEPMIFAGGVDLTDENGRYQFSFTLPPCPGFDYEMSVDVWTELRYSAYTPHGAPTLPYFMRIQDWAYCIGLAANPALLAPGPSVLSAPIGPTVAASVASIIQNVTVPVSYVNFYVDVMMLTGFVTIANEAVNLSPQIPGGSTGTFVLIPIADETSYQEPSHTIQVNNMVLDLNRDETPDTLAAGLIVEATVTLDANAEEGSPAECNLQGQATGPEAEVGKIVDCFKTPEDEEEPQILGLYFSAADLEAGKQPDLFRVFDFELKDQSEGLLASISEQDMQKTDIMIFRESTGELVTTRKGMSDEEIANRRSATYIDQNNNGQTIEQFYVQIPFRGPYDSSLNIGGFNRQGTYEQWASEHKMAEPFSTREGDHVRAGERLVVVAINRATGYMGTKTVTMGENTTLGNIATVFGTLNDPLVMLPPNLKIWAERNYEVEHGLTEGEEREHLIGAEGASLTSDEQVVVYTEWYDHDGSPLPAGLGQGDGNKYGYTGRFAKVVAPSLLSSTNISGSGVAEFAIKPGRQAQVLRIGDNLTRPEHYYIHINGTPKDDVPNFATDIAKAEPYNTRPEFLTPVQVPLFDEVKNWTVYNAYRDLQEAYDNHTEGSIDPNKPDPIYAWHHRPEYQFSQVMFEMQEINSNYTTSDGSEAILNNINTEQPVISSGDDLLEAVYDFAEASFNRLDPIDGPQELILAIGEEEHKVTIGEDQKIEFTNIVHLSELAPEEFLTIRLYSNNDSANTLWEWAFQQDGLKLTTSDDEGSNAAGSFVYCRPSYVGVPGLDLCNSIEPIKAELLTHLSPTDIVQWRVEAEEGNLGGTDLPDDGDNGANEANKPFMYGKTNDWKIGSIVPNVTASGTGTGKNGQPWQSSGLNFYNDAKHFSYKADMSEEAHRPTTYTKGSPGGTKYTDARRRNPHVGHDITVYVNGTERYQATAKMDEIDVLRQEYMDLIYITRNDTPLSAYQKGVRVPEREQFVKRVDLPAETWVANYFKYSVVLNDGMIELWAQLSEAISTNRGVDLDTENTKTFQIPDEASYRLASGYRHPEQNERIKGASGSRHMMGKAIDVDFQGLHRVDDAVEFRQAYYALWRLLENDLVTRADRYALEDAPGVTLIARSSSGNPVYGDNWNDEDEDGDGIWDILDTVTHMHIQENP